MEKLHDVASSCLPRRKEEDHDDDVEVEEDACRGECFVFSFLFFLLLFCSVGEQMGGEGLPMDTDRVPNARGEEAEEEEEAERGGGGFLYTTVSRRNNRSDTEVAASCGDEEGEDAAWMDSGENGTGSGEEGG